MLKINLLPIRQLQKHARASNEVIGFAVIFLFFLIALVVAGVLQTNHANAIQADITRLNQEKLTYDKVLAEIKKLEADKQELERKIKLIKQLKKEASLTVHVLDEVATRLDSKRMWLTSLDQQANSLALTGIALDNKTIADFMNALDASPFINNINLSDSSLTQVAGQELKAFSLQCAISFPTEETDKTK